jgi:hypothetical protein
MQLVSPVELPVGASAPCPGLAVGGVLKLNLKTREVAQALGSERLFQRLRHAGWLTPLYRSRDALYPVSQLLRIQARMESGELPPLLPSEVKQRGALRGSP